MSLDHFILYIRIKLTKNVYVGKKQNKRKSLHFYQVFSKH